MPEEVKADGRGWPILDGASSVEVAEKPDAEQLRVDSGSESVKPGDMGGGVLVAGSLCLYKAGSQTGSLISY